MRGSTYPEPTLYSPKTVSVLALELDRQKSPTNPVINLYRCDDTLNAIALISVLSESSVDPSAVSMTIRS